MPNDPNGTTKKKPAPGGSKRQNEQMGLQAAALEAAANAILIANSAGEITWVNSAFTRLTGYTAEEVIGKNPRLLKSGAHPLSFYQDMWKTVLSGQVWRGEMTNQKKDGTTYFEEQTITPVRDAQGTISHFIAIKQDITDRKRFEERLRQASKMEAVGQLAGGVAHDFNNLLGVIIGFSELLLEDEKPGSVAGHRLEQIRDAAERATGLTRQLLAFSRQQVLEPTVINLNEVIQNSQKFLGRLIPENIEIRLKLAPQLGLVKVDRTQIDQVLINLAANARDAMPRGGTLHIETMDVELDAAYVQTHYPVVAGPYVMLSVGDTGTGMDQETQAKIFEPFFTTKEMGKGTGLGLATVYGIVKQSGGFIWVYSEPGQGATFKIYLPRTRESAPARPSSAISPQELTGTETILVVEDSEPLRAMVCDALAGKGYNVLEAKDGTDALAACDKHPGPIQLLVTDIIMPGMNGAELAERVLRIRPQSKVLYVSGYPYDAIAQHGVLEPGVAFLQKPFGPVDLARKVRTVLDTPAER